MALTSPKMGLTIWNQVSDPFDHNQLADNFSKIDFHDHTPGRGVQIASEGIADGAITPIKLSSTVDPTGAYSTYRLLEAGSSIVGAAVVAGTYALAAYNPTATLLTAGIHTPFYFDPADYLSSPRTTNLRVEGIVLVHTAVAPAANFTFGLFPITAVAAGVLTVGAAVASSTAAVSAPLANSFNRAITADFSAPVAGYYALGVTTSATTAASSGTSLRAHLHMRQT